jgi:hypothetical protein
MKEPTLNAIQKERIAGAAVLLSLGLAAFAWLPALRTGEETSTTAQLVKYATQTTLRPSAIDESKSLVVRDPIFLEGADAQVAQVGYVETVKQLNGGRQVEFRWYTRDVSPDQCEFTAYQNSGRLDEAFALMFPPEKQARIQSLVEKAMQEHGERLSIKLTPIVERSLKNSLPAIESGFRESVNRHRDQVEALGARWNEQVVKQQLLPLAKSEIVPIVRRRGEPLANEIGRELWERASIWSFTWRALYDKSPLPQKDLMKQEWERFVDEEAIPVLEEHADDIATAIQQSMIEVAGNAKVRRELAAAAETIAADKETRALVQTILRESIVDNQSLRHVWRDAWTSAEAQAAIADASRALEPTIRKIGDELMGSRELGIDPAFARLLRNQVLQKDQRWVIAKRTANPTTSSITIRKAVTMGTFPMPSLTRE